MVRSGTDTIDTSRSAAIGRIAKAPGSPRDGPRITDLLMCIGEMCATTLSEKMDMVVDTRGQE